MAGQGNRILLGENFQEDSQFSNRLVHVWQQYRFGRLSLLGKRSKAMRRKTAKLLLRMDLTDATVVPIQEPVD